MFANHVEYAGRRRVGLFRDCKKVLNCDLRRTGMFLDPKAAKCKDTLASKVEGEYSRSEDIGLHCRSTQTLRSDCPMVFEGAGRQLASMTSIFSQEANQKSA